MMATLAPCGSPAAPLAPLYVLVDSSTEMPQAVIVDQQVIGGIHRDVGLALAARLGRQVQFRVLPRKRILDALLGGVESDLICGYLPAWLPGELDWSHAFLPDEQLLISSRAGPAPDRLGELAGRRVGTVLGFVYPELEQALGAAFEREDAPNAAANLRKLSLGRIQLAVVGRLQFDYLRRQGELTIELHRPLVVSSYRAQCALSRHGSLKMADLNRAIDALQAEGGVERILAKYR